MDECLKMFRTRLNTDTEKCSKFSTLFRSPYGRAEDLDCCDSLLISATSPNSPALLAQDEKFGVYRLQYVDRSPLGQGRATFKHIERDLFLYFVSDGQIDGWIVGPKPGASLGGLFSRVSLDKTE